MWPFWSHPRVRSPTSGDMNFNIVVDYFLFLPNDEFSVWKQRRLFSIICTLCIHTECTYSVIVHCSLYFGVPDISKVLKIATNTLKSPLRCICVCTIIAPNIHIWSRSMKQLHECAIHVCYTLPCTEEQCVENQVVQFLINGSINQCSF